MAEGTMWTPISHWGCSRGSMCQSARRWGRVPGEGPVQAKSVGISLGWCLFRDEVVNMCL